MRHNSTTGGVHVSMPREPLTNHFPITRTNWPYRSPFPHAISSRFNTHGLKLQTTYLRQSVGRAPDASKTGEKRHRCPWQRPNTNPNNPPATIIAPKRSTVHKYYPISDLIPANSYLIVQKSMPICWITAEAPRVSFPTPQSHKQSESSCLNRTAFTNL